MFDEQLLIEIKITITKLLEKTYGLLGKTIDRADEHDRRMVENDMRLVELKTVSEQRLSDRYCIFER